MNYTNNNYLTIDSESGKYDRGRIPYGILVYIFSMLLIILVCWRNIMKMLHLFGCIRPRQKIYAVEEMHSVRVENPQLI
jgi:hypothetical protein